jgi:hypothetical protein
LDHFVPGSRTKTRTISRALCSLLLLCSLVASPALAQHSQRTHRVPFHTASGLILLDATANGKPASLILDTGADFTLISPEAARVPLLSAFLRLPRQIALANNSGSTSAGVSVNIPAGGFFVGVTNTDAGCTTQPANVMVTLEYVMQ